MTELIIAVIVLALLAVAFVAFRTYRRKGSIKVANTPVAKVKDGQ